MHLAPVLLMALPAAVGDLPTPCAPPQWADHWVNLLPNKDVTVGTSLLKDVHGNPNFCRSHYLHRPAWNRFLVLLCSLSIKDTSVLFLLIQHLNSFVLKRNYELYFEWSRVGSADTGSLLCQPASGNMSPSSKRYTAFKLPFCNYFQRWHRVSACQVSVRFAKPIYDLSPLFHQDRTVKNVLMTKIWVTDT